MHVVVNDWLQPTLKMLPVEILLNLYFYEPGGLTFNWYDNYRSKALLTSYDDKEKGSDH